MTTKDKIEQIARDVIVRHSRYAQPLKEKWTELYNRYENELRESSITASTEAKIRLGAAYSLVENFVSKVIAQNPRFRYLARERGDSKPADVYNEFSEYQHDIAKSQDVFEEIAKWGGICGLSGFKMGWKIEDIIIKKRGKEVMGKRITNPILVDMADKLKIGSTVKIDETETISNWTITALKPHDLIWDPEATHPDNSLVKGHRVRKTCGELKAEGYDIKPLIGLVKAETDYWREQMTKYSPGTSVGTILENIPVEVAELYVQYDNNGIRENYVITLAGVSDGGTHTSPVAVGFEPNPFDKQFCPIGFFRPIRRPGKVEGFGVIEPVESVLDAEEDNFNINLQAAWVDVARPMEYVPDNVLNEEGIEYGSRVLIPVKELGKSVSVLPTPSPNMPTANFLGSYLERAKQNITAITDYQTGGEQIRGSKTATEVQTKAFLSEQRLNKILRSFETEVLEAAGRMSLWLNQQYLGDTPKIIYRVLGKKGSILENQVKFKDIEAVKDLAIVSGSSAYIMQQEMRNKWMSLLQLSGQEAMLPPGVGIPFDREVIAQHMLEEGYLIKDSENFIPSLKEREEATVAQKMANIDDAKQENLDPATARVIPTDIHSVHIALHKAALQAQGAPGPDGQTIPYTPEQMVLMTSHLNAHVAMAGGVSSGINQAMEQAVGQKINNQMNPNEQVPSVPGQQPGGGQIA